MVLLTWASVFRAIASAFCLACEGDDLPPEVTVQIACPSWAGSVCIVYPGTLTGAGRLRARRDRIRRLKTVPLGFRTPCLPQQPLPWATSLPGPVLGVTMGWSGIRAGLEL